MLEAFLEWVGSRQHSNKEKLPPERADAESSEVGVVLRFHVMRRDGFRCAMCGRGPSGRNGVELHVEHVIPFSEGGKTVLKNLRTRCGQCDATKSVEGVVATSGVRFPKNCPDELWLDEVRRAARLVERRKLTQADFKRLCGISTSTILRRCGSWRAVLERAGLDHMYAGAPRARYSGEELLAEVRRVARIVGRQMLTKNDFIHHSRIDESTIRRRFGDWAAALERAGVDHDIFEE